MVFLRLDPAAPMSKRAICLTSNLEPAVRSIRAKDAACEEERATCGRNGRPTGEARRAPERRRESGVGAEFSSEAGGGGEYVSDGLEGADRLPAGGFDHGSDVGVLFCALLGAEAVGDFPVGGAGTQRTLGLVVGWGDGAVGHEDKKVGAELFDRAFPFDPGGMSGGSRAKMRSRSASRRLLWILSVASFHVSRRAASSQATPMKWRSAGAKMASPSSMTYCVSRRRWARQT